MCVWRLSTMANELSCVGSRCWTTTQAMPDGNSTTPSNSMSACKPPADAPMPTMGKTP